MDALMLQVLDVFGTVAFAISGATLGIRRRFDLFGVLVLAALTATAGGVLRDVLMGATPPTALTSWRPLTIATAAGLVTFWFERWIRKLNSPVRLFDAAGLGAFAVAGTQKALLWDLPWASAVLLGLITGVGGGVVRDVMAGQSPDVLRRELYAVPAILAGLIVVGAEGLGLRSHWVALVAVGACFLLRKASIRRHWELPASRPLDSAEDAGA